MIYLKPLKNILSVFVFVSLFFIINENANAGFGISPSDIINDHLKPGAHYEKIITLSRSDSNEELKATVDVEVDGAQDWFKFEPGKEFLLPYGQERFPLKVIIDIPANAEFKKYEGSIRIKAGTIDEEKAGVSVVKGAKVQVMLATTNLDVTNLLARRVSLENSDDANKVPLLMYLENIGNVDTAPTKAVVDVEDLTGNKIKTYEVTEFEKIPAGELKEITSHLKTDLAPGEYFGIIKLYLNDNLLIEIRDHFRIDAKAPVEEDATDQSQEIVAKVERGGLTKFITGNIPLLSVAFGILLLMILIIIILLAKRKHKNEEDSETLSISADITKSKHNQTNNKANRVLMLIIIVLILLAGVLFVLVYLTGNDKLTVKIISPIAKNKVSEELALNTNESTQEVSTPEENAEVMGVSDVSKNKPELSDKSVEKATLKVIGVEAEGIYNVYEKPDTTSKVIYTAKEGEILPAHSENDGWYEVSVPENNAGKLKGWIQKANIKNTESDKTN